MTNNLTIRWHLTANEAPNTLWNDCLNPPLEGKWWHETLEQSQLDDQFQFLYATVWQDKKPIAITPMFTMNVPIAQVIPDWLLPLFVTLGRFFPCLLTQRTLFIGSPCSDEGTIGIIDGIDRYQVLECLQHAFRKQAKQLGAPMLVWKDFPDSYAEDLVRISAHYGWFRLTSFPGTIVTLTTKENYWAALKGSHRHVLKKKLRRSAENVTIDTDVIQFPDAQTLDEIFGLFVQTYEKAVTKFEKLNRPFFKNIAAQPSSYFIVLREHASGDIIAFMLCFASDKHVINKFIGIDYARPKEWFLYFKLWEAVLDWALERGALSIQSGQTGYRPKIELGHSLISLTNYCRHTNPFIHLIYKLVAKTINWSTLDPYLINYANNS